MESKWHSWPTTGRVVRETPRLYSIPFSSTLRLCNYRRRQNVQHHWRRVAQWYWR